jgi:hypothetical protein
MRLTFIAFLILLLTAHGCSIKPRYYSDDKKRAEKAIEQYHDAFNRRNYDEIYENAHPDAKATKSREKLAQVLSQLYESLGKVQGSTLVKADVTTVSTKERKIEMIYRTQFENGVRNELFTCFSDDSVARLHTLGVATDEELQQANIP